MKKLLIALVLFVLSLTAVHIGTNIKLLAAANSLSQNSQDACAGLGLDDNCSPETGSKNLDVKSIVRNVLQVFSWLAGVLSVIFVIVGGIKYTTSGGNDEAIGSAKKTITYALIGLVITALAQIIVRYVLAKTVGNS